MDIATAAGATVGFNDPIRVLVMKWAQAVGCTHAATYNAPMRQLLIQIAVAKGVTVPVGASQRVILKAMAAGSGYNATIRLLLLKLAGG